MDFIYFLLPILDGCLVAEKQIYVLGNFVAQKLFTTTDGIENILYTQRERGRAMAEREFLSY